MKRNIGIADMVIRLLISIALFYVGFFNNPVVSGGISQKIVAVAAFVPLLTGIFRFCPLYTFIGLNTCACGEKSKA